MISRVSSPGRHDREAAGPISESKLPEAVAARRYHAASTQRTELDGIVVVVDHDAGPRVTRLDPVSHEFTDRLLEQRAAPVIDGAFGLPLGHVRAGPGKLRARFIGGGVDSDGKSLARCA